MRKQRERDRHRKLEHSVALGTSLGLAASVGLGAAFDQVALGICFGLLGGVAWGYSVARRGE